MKPASRAELVDIGQVILNGVVFDFKNWQGGTVDAAHLPQAVARLFAQLSEKQINYVLVGALAVLHYVEGRNTQDVDLIVDADSLEKLTGLEITGRDKYFARGTFEGLRVDLLLTTHPLFQRVREHYSAMRPFQGQTVRCATVEGLILLKLFALTSLYRQGDFTRVGLYENDVATLLRVYRPDLGPLQDELKPHLSASDFGELRKIIEELLLRIERLERVRDRF